MDWASLFDEAYPQPGASDSVLAQSRSRQRAVALSI
jgi:hypothetical protein